MEITALTCEKDFELMGYVAKIDTLGKIILALAEAESECLSWEGGNIGGIISDYAEAIKNVLNGLEEVITRTFNYGDASFLSELKKTQRDIEEGFMGLRGNIDLIGRTICKIDQFMVNDVKPIEDLKAWLEDARGSIQRQLMSGSKQKETPAKAAKADQN